MGIWQFFDESWLPSSLVIAAVTYGLMKYWPKLKAWEPATSPPPTSDVVVAAPATAVLAAAAPAASRWPQLAEWIARYLLLDDALKNFDAAMEKATAVRSTLDLYFSTPAEERPDQPSVQPALDQWSSALAVIDWIGSRCYEEDPNVSLGHRYRISRQPVPAHLGLSPTAENEYVRFYEQVTNLETEGRQLRYRVQIERQEVLKRIFSAAQGLRFET